MREEFPPVCVIRPYRKGDEVTIQEIMTEATMETVGEFFWAAVMSEVFPQVALLAIAVSFIGLGIPFYFCLFGIPVAIIIIYVVIWSAHSFKVEYEFLTEAQLEAKDIDLEGQRRHIVGTVAITKSLRGGSKAWLRRMAVKKMYRRRGIAMGLLDEVIQFCTDRCYEEIELITTECHYKARELYYKRGFEARHTYFKYYLNVQQPMYLFSLPLKPPEAELSEISAS
ncbi:uncharacterized protein LOC121869348 isoform X2 [Homarus americanus]|uniref:uncharacterized protein LOC121869348 isoform X2 n=1 Tax=Homarus americanus TaxID=6706 RepID=UPI001C481933|nr:uncharacterized protein LOC121869348 isoform X2 [Homarus americanus]